MTGRILCSTGALIGRKNGFNHHLLEAFAPRLSCDGFEVMLYEAWYANLKTIIEDIKQSGVPVVTVHEDKQIGELISRNGEGDLQTAIERHKRNSEAAARLGAGITVLHLWNGVPSDKHIEFNIEAYAQLREISDAYGLVLAVENVICNTHSPLKNICSLADSFPDAKFTFDTKMAAFHGELEETCQCERLWQSGSIVHVHVNDYAGAVKDWSDLKVQHIGDGNVNFNMVFDTLKKYGYSGDFTLECSSVNDDGSIRAEQLNASIEKVREFLRNQVANRR